MMKRLIPLLLALCLVLCACGSDAAGFATGMTTDATTEATTEETTEATTEAPTTEAPTTEPPVIYRNPLNGAVLEEAWSGRAAAVVINNIKACLPQYGTSQADILYEVETESGITRMLSIFEDFSGVETLGPVRSTRTFFNNIARSYDAPIFHCGGSVRGRNGYSDISGSKISGWEHVDQTYNGAYFFRDENRYYNQGYNWEHTLFATGEKLTKALTDKEFASVTERADFGLQFETDVVLAGETANRVTATFTGGKTTTFTYDLEAKLYRAAQYGSDYIDAGNGEHVSFRNVIILSTEQSYSHDGEYRRSYYDLVGSGEGMLAIDGKIVPVTWSRESLDSAFTFALADGSAAVLAEGHTYVAVTGASKPVSFE